MVSRVGSIGLGIILVGNYRALYSWVILMGHFIGGQTLGLFSWAEHVSPTLGSFSWAKLVGQTRGSNSWIIVLGQTQLANTCVILMGQICG